jgi:hypothetical protein
MEWPRPPTDHCAWSATVAAPCGAAHIIILELERSCPMRFLRWYSKLSFIASALVLALALQGTGRAQALEASACGGTGQVVCKQNESCVNIIFYKQCTTTFDYYSDKLSEDSGNNGGNTDTPPEEVEPLPKPAVSKFNLSKVWDDLDQVV